MKTDPDILITILNDALELMSEGWCQNALARESKGSAVSCYSPAASQWSIEGSVRRVTAHLIRTPLMFAEWECINVLTHVCQESYDLFYWNLNDYGTSLQVGSLFIKAMDYLEDLKLGIVEDISSHDVEILEPEVPQ